MIKLTCGYLAAMSGMMPASKSMPFLYTSLLITTTVTGDKNTLQDDDDDNDDDDDDD
jgi:hypothetical protein